MDIEGRMRTDEKSRKLNQQDLVTEYRVQMRKVGVRDNSLVSGLENQVDGGAIY